MNDGQLLRSVITMVEDDLLQSDDEREAAVLIAKTAFDRLFAPLKSLTEDEWTLLAQKKKLHCIKLVKSRTGLSLMKCKKLVEGHMQSRYGRKHWS